MIEKDIRFNLERHLRCARDHLGKMLRFNDEESFYRLSREFEYFEEDLKQIRRRLIDLKKHDSGIIREVRSLK